VAALEVLEQAALNQSVVTVHVVSQSDDLSIEDAARQIGCSVAMLLRLIAAEQGPPHVGSAEQMRFKLADVLLFKDALRASRRDGMVALQADAEELGLHCVTR
jgi:hypothetical protein